MDIKSLIRTIPDYPKPGIMFRDVTSLWGDARGFRRVVDELVQPYAGTRIDKVAGIESRGFVIGGAVAHQLSIGFVPVRKKGKLPWKTLAEDYALEYGHDTLEMHVDSVKPGEQVLIVDDLIATGGTVEAAIKLVRRMEGVVVGCAFIVDLPDLGGRARVEALDVPVFALASYEGH
ncbi:MAG: adenine phosphoribosyltransferase [Alphaproteobacteria bacterium]|nr:adenine phosphoribosyltransferase [Alphaproteobacteria bacterium]MDX5370759.1 adenine phosphoribosyltransferase [Alphaproteobacteria bacterium]MDX5465173.1 adenine phosphoribosyltransferase [Alphaproteobacteria bacterium]